MKWKRRVALEVSVGLKRFEMLGGMEKEICQSVPISRFMLRDCPRVYEGVVKEEEFDPGDGL